MLVDSMECEKKVERKVLLLENDKAEKKAN
jgi:hypothetical protein